jgi:hypothetical protein
MTCGKCSSGLHRCTRCSTVFCYRCENNGSTQCPRCGWATVFAKTAGAPLAHPSHDLRRLEPTNVLGPAEQRPAG